MGVACESMSITHLDLIKIVQKKQGDLSLRSYAISLGVSAAYLSDVYRGRRDAGPTLLKHFGYRRTKTITVLYFKVQAAAK